MSSGLTSFLPLRLAGASGHGLPHLDALPKERNQIALR
jgi:hypothetical protein